MLMKMNYPSAMPKSTKRRRQMLAKCAEEKKIMHRRMRYQGLQPSHGEWEVRIE